MENKFPLVSVLMPVYNCEQYIEESVNSILNQSYINFELIIIDDCSNDSTLNILSNYSDERIQIVKKEKNTGYTNSLNYGLKIAKGKYISRMDGDDISYKERFEKQVSFLESNPDFVLCGSNYQIIGSNELIKLPEHSEKIKIELLSSCCLAHPSVMYRKEAIIENNLQYNPDREPAEDYALWVKLIFIGKIYNFQEPLLYYRVHEQQISQTKYSKQVSSALESRYELITQNSNSFSSEESIFLKQSLSKNFKINPNDFQVFKEVKDKILALNSNEFFNTFDFENFISKWERKGLLSYFYTKNRYSPTIFFKYLNVRFRYNLKLNFKDAVLLFAKSFVFYKMK